jgi:hypothetical protein
VATADPDFALDLTTYLEQFAGRAFGYEVAEPTLAESKGLTLSLLTHHVADGFDPAAQCNYRFPHVLGSFFQSDWDRWTCGPAYRVKVSQPLRRP